MPVQEAVESIRSVGVTQGCDALTCSRETLYKLMRNGELPFFRVGRSRRIRLDVLQAYTENRDPWSVVGGRPSGSFDAA